MATAKTSTKKATKKATKKPAAKKGDVVSKNSVEGVALNATQQGLVDTIIANEKRIVESAVSLIPLMVESGKALITLKAHIQKNHGRVWKGWAEKNLPMSYRQIARYMQMGENKQKTLSVANGIQKEGDTPGMLEICARLSAKDTPEKREERKEASDKKKAAANAPVADGTITEETFAEIDACEDITMLRGLIDYIEDRIEKINAIPSTAAYDEEQDGSDAADDDADAAEHVAAIA